MSTVSTAMTASQGVGALLRQWRVARRMSQLDVALAAQVSTKHLSFLETGRARPSREMLLVLASVLDVPLRDRNALLHAAGFAPAYRETDLAAPEMRGVRRALELLLRQHEPFGALVMNGAWEVLMVNAGYARFMALLGFGGLPEPYALAAAPRINALEALFAPGGLRQHIANWDVAGRAVAERLERELLAEGDPRRRALFERVMALPGVTALLRSARGAPPEPLLVPVELAVGEARVRLFSTVATLGTAQDITLQELRIESFHPADEDSERLARALATA